MRKELEQVSLEIPTISDLTNRPNQPMPYGGDGLGAEALKARFDALPLAVREKLNRLLTILSGEDGAFYIGVPCLSYDEGRKKIESVGDLYAAMQDTGLAQLLMVQLDETQRPLQSVLQECMAELSRAFQYGSIQDGVLHLYNNFAEETQLRINPIPETVADTILTVVDGHSYVIPEGVACKINYPSVPLISSDVWDDSMQGLGATTIVFESATDATGVYPFTQMPEAGAVCVVRLGDKTEVVQTVFADGQTATLRAPNLEITMAQTAGGVRVTVTEENGGYIVGEPVDFYIKMYLNFVATIRVYIGENGVIEPIPPALYRGEAPEYSRNSVWDLRVENGVVDAKQVATALQAKQLAKQKAEAILEEVENGTY